MFARSRTFGLGLYYYPMIFYLKFANKASVAATTSCC